MLELLFLLLPVAAVYGYFMGRASMRSKALQSRNRNRTAYLKGVEYLLSNNQEKAVDNFITYLNTSDPTFETRMALGNLLRQRGETEKAIALHEKMASDPESDETGHELSRLELARDFLNAGVFDQAEELLKQLLEIPRQRAESAKLLLKVYEREGDFRKAAEVAVKFGRESGLKIASQLCNYFCELGREEQSAGRDDQAEGLFRKALEQDRDAVRPRLMLADVYLKKGRNAEAETLVREAGHLDPGMGMLCLDYLKRCYANRADPKYRIALEDLVRTTKSASAVCELASAVLQDSGPHDAEELLARALHEKHNIKIFSKLLEIRSRGLDARENETVSEFRSLIDAQAASSPRYVCRRCGFESSVMFWQCPSCRKWNSLKPRGGIDGD